MPSDVIEQFSVLDRPSIKKIKQEILDRALDRHKKIERGECDVPIHYVPLPVATLYDLLGQLEYRSDSLSLAVPPPNPGWPARCKRKVKQLVASALRWLFIRQVEFNRVSLEHAREISEQLASADRNLAEFIASFGALKLQVHTFAERLARLESNGPRPSATVPSQSSVLSAENEHSFHQALWPFLKGRGPILAFQTGQIDLLKFLVSEGLDASGIETDADTVEKARDRDLPVEPGQPLAFLESCSDDSLDVVILGDSVWQQSAREVNRLLGMTWHKLRQGGLVLAMAKNSACREGPLPAAFAGSVKLIPVELLTYALESHCFWVADMLFWHPVSDEHDAVAQASKCWAYDLKQYHSYMLFGVRD
jgi:Methionine biosynthesis protein MetW